MYVGIIATALILSGSVGFATGDVELKEYNFDSYFKMDVPKDVEFVKEDGNGTGNISLLKSYKDADKKINVVYCQSKNNAKEELINYYQNMAKNDSYVIINEVNNTTVIHFGDENTIGDIEYHDMAIAGDDTQYILIQCDNQDFMNSMVNSIKLN